MDYVALKAELDAGHPDTGVYNVDDFLALAQINLANRTRVKLSMTGREVREQTDNTEYNALSAALQGNWIAFTQPNAILDPRPGSVDEQITFSIFAAGTTRTNLATARNETVSRAVELGFGDVIIGDIQNARAL